MAEAATDKLGVMVCRMAHALMRHEANQWAADVAMADRSLCPAALIFALIHVQFGPPAVASGEPFELLFQLGLAAFGGVAGVLPSEGAAAGALLPNVGGSLKSAF